MQLYTVSTGRTSLRDFVGRLRSAQVQPVPDVALKLVVQKDYTTPPFYTTANIELGVPVPVWDRNQGGIMSARAQPTARVRAGSAGRPASTCVMADSRS